MLILVFEFSINIFVYNPSYLFFFWLCLWPLGVLGQGLNLHHSSDLSLCSNNTGSLTCCTTGGAPNPYSCYSRLQPNP